MFKISNKLVDHEKIPLVSNLFYYYFIQAQLWDFNILILQLIILLLFRFHLRYFQQAPSGLLRGPACPGHDWRCQHPVQGGRWAPEEARYVSCLMQLEQPYTATSMTWRNIRISLKFIFYSSLQGSVQKKLKKQYWYC